MSKEDEDSYKDNVLSSWIKPAKNCKYKYSEIARQRNSKKTKWNRTSFSSLRFLSETQPNEILLTLLDEQCGVLSLLYESNVKPSLLAYMFIVLGKACSSDLSANVNNFIKSIRCKFKNILLHVQRYLQCLQKEQGIEKNHLDSVLYLTIFLEKFQSTVPSSFSDSMSTLLPLLDSVSEKCLKVHEGLYHLVSIKLKELNDQNEYFLKHTTLFEMKKDPEREKLHLQETTENFRSLPVLPTAEDIHLPCLFLRPNIVKGKYKNTEHYLDVQYRLLREDYVKPLRDGIAEYLNMKKNGESFKKCKDVKVYTNVRIEGESFLNGDLIHVLKFSDKCFSTIKWEQSQRFLTQSLLCLSLDDFQTMLFAAVIHRDPKDLKRGLLYIRFEEITEKVLNLNHSMNFVIIETSAYFEAYRHNLMALQQLRAESLPLKEYIIDVQKTVSCPRYLKSTTAYDMRPLLLPLDENHINVLDGIACYKYPGNFSNDGRSVKLLDECCWPTMAELNFDHSQYLALKAAITKEFAIVQGPPGTGKTYIGLRIVQLLLHNLGEWFSTETNSLPILIVCYTNHALDQFLEGVLLFTTKVVRIGGRCSNDKILEFQLRDLKKSAIDNRLFPQYISNNIRQKNMELKRIKEKIDKIKECIEISANTVLNELELEKHIYFIHLLTLKEGHLRQPQQQSKFALYDWLGIGLYAGKSVINHYKEKPAECSFDTARTNEEFISEDEADIEYIENQRTIDFYDFEHFAFNKSSEAKYEYDELKDSEWSPNDSEWQTQESKNQRFELVKYVRDCLENFEALTEDVVMLIDHVWHIDYGKRWGLYKYWLQNFIKEKSKESSNLQKELKTTIQEMVEIRAEEDLYILQRSHIVGMTTSGAAKYRHLVQRLNPAILLVEEAAELLESHVVTSLAPNTQHVVLIGDQQQLRPSPTVHMLAVKYDFNISLFERMIINGVDYCSLSTQYRMRPEIAALIVPHIYPNLKNHRVVTEFESIKGVEKNVFFVSHYIHESPESDSKSKINEYEAKFLIQFCRYLILQGYDPSQITILTTYSGQLYVLKNLATDDVKEVRFTVVDNFQGEENDIILISFVRSNDDGIIGFLKVSNRVCVALSRAKKGLFCVGNFTLLAEKSNLWKNIYRTLIQKRSIGPSFRLRCQNHPDTYTEVSSAVDFRRVPDGGCSKKCASRLLCGHACYLMCHPYDHGSIICYKPCSKTCDRGHYCEKKCFEECYCKVLVDRTLNRCGHTVNELCGKPECEIICPFDCKRTLECTHPCPNICGEKCATKCHEPCLKTCDKGHQCQKHCFDFCGSCEVLVDKTLKRCGHTVKDFCGKSEYAIMCSFKCEEILSCTHLCSNRCGERCETKCRKPCLKNCEKGHLCHKKCFESCGLCKVLVDKTFVYCGHTVKVSCGKYGDENVCSFRCDKELNCGHYCPKSCGEPCVETCMQLKETVSPICGHPTKVQCNIADSTENVLKECSEELFKTCSAQCKDILLCGHKCSGTCGRCYQKRLHIPCKESCRRILVCGHRCQSTCSRSCPPCQKPCENKCLHSKCPKKCGKPCRNCTKPCEWSCSHKKCTSPCSEVCNRELCNEPCMKILPCGHSCIGFCGEPCPKLCRICDTETKESIFYGLENAAKYVLLEDCGHVFEVRGLNRWLIVTLGGNKKIRMKTCPMCKTVIRKNIRYNDVIKDSLSQLEAIKKITEWNKAKNIELQSALLKKSVSLNSVSYFKTYNNLYKCLSSPSIRNIKELTNIENMISIAIGLNSLNIKGTPSELSSEPQQKLFEYAQVTCKWVSDFILKYFLTMSEHQLLQLAYEVHRLRLIARLLQFAEQIMFESQYLEFEECSRCLLNYAPFNDCSIKSFESAFEALTSKLVGKIEDICKPIEFPYLKAMDMSVGHWYMCSKGHAYCIIEYVGTIGKGCHECLTKKKDKPLLSRLMSSDISLTGSIYRWPRLSTSIRTDTEFQSMTALEKRKENQIWKKSSWNTCTSESARRRRQSDSYPNFFQRSYSSSSENWRVHE